MKPFPRSGAVRGVIAQTEHFDSRVERRTKVMLGRSIKREIARVRLERVKLLLQESDPKIAEVATRTRFAESKYLGQVFSASERMMPTKYREQRRDKGLL